jgi:hypothetical protein
MSNVSGQLISLSASQILFHSSTRTFQLFHSSTLPGLHGIMTEGLDRGERDEISLWSS